MMFVYDPVNGAVVPDGRVDEWWDVVVKANEPGKKFSIGCELMLHRARVGLVKGDIAHLIIEVDKKAYLFDEDGSPPEGFWPVVPTKYTDYLSTIYTDYLSTIIEGKMVAGTPNN